jgi:myo-inositol-1(or 4)-monophosphatase
VLLETGLLAQSAQPELKGLHDYVTDTDRASEAAILKVLALETPGIPVLAEEGGGDRADLMWAVDPLDGTTNYTRGFPVVAVSVGLLEGRTPRLGVVVGPFLGLEFVGGPGFGLTRNGQKLPSLGQRDPATAIVATGFPFRNPARRGTYQPVMEGALAAFEDLRRPGAAALDLAWTASGTFDGFFELGLGTWDVVGGAALVSAAGGTVTDWEGGDGWPVSGDILAGAPGVHEALLELAAAPKRARANQAGSNA